MAESVYEVLLSNHPKLVKDILDDSEELSKFLMLVYSHVLYAAMEQSGDPKDIYFAYDIPQDGKYGDYIKIRMLYKSREGRSNLDGKNPVKRNFNLVSLCQSNSNVKDIAIRVTEMLQRWCNEKPYRKTLGLKSLKFENAVFYKDLIFAADLMFKVQWEEMLKMKKIFPDENELQTEHPMIQGGYLI